MNIFPIKFSEENRLVAFEIDNIYVSKTTIASILATVKNVTHLRIRKPFSGHSEVLVWFEYEGEQFIVWEPYGDSSRYWIGPENPDGFTGDITPVADAFKIYKPSLLRQGLGGIVNFNFSTTQCIWRVVINN